MKPRPVIAVRGPNGKPSADAVASLDKSWHLRYLLLAPHRLG